MSLEQQLTQGCEQLRLSFKPSVITQLCDFVRLLDKWNQHYSLTAVRDPKRMVAYHILDSLAVLPFISGKNILDVGTGPGLPGIPLALALPDKQFTLLDSNGKKIRFIQEACRRLKLKNVTPVQARVENFGTESCFDVIITRAVGKIAQTLAWCEPLCCKGGQFLFMKGRDPEAELPAGLNHYQLQRLQVPDVEGERHLLIISKGL